MAKKFYAVKMGKGGISGIYLTWDECKAQVEGVSGVRYKSFPTMEEAEAFLRGEEAPKTPKSEKSEKSAEKEAAPPYKEGVAVAYVDGSYKKDTKEFSCGAVLFWNNETVYFSQKYSDPDMADMRNVAGEIMGAVSVIDYCVKNGIEKLEIYHDYNGVAKWATGEWKTNKAGTQAYAQFCRDVKDKIDIKFIEVKGHSGDYWNDAADRLAKKALGIE